MESDTALTTRTGRKSLAMREVLRYKHVESVTLVDIDPEMTRLASTHPLLVKQNAGAYDDPRVEVLLRTHEKVGDFLNKPVVEQLAAPSAETPRGRGGTERVLWRPPPTSASRPPMASTSPDR